MTAATAEPVLEEKRARILDAAKRVCQRTDLDSAKMADIAAEARVSKGTLYRFFDNKEDLLVAMVIATYDEHLARLRTTLQRGGARERLAGYVRHITELAPATREQNRINFQALAFAARDPGAEQRLHGYYLSYYEAQKKMLLEVFHDGQRDGVVRPDVDVQAAVSCLLAVTDGFLWRATFDPSFSTARVEASFEHVLGQLIIPAAN